MSVEDTMWFIYEEVEKNYWVEHYKLFPNERPKRRGRKPSK